MPALSKHGPAKMQAAGWTYNSKHGELLNGEPPWVNGSVLCTPFWPFVFSQALRPGDVWKARVEVVDSLLVGFAGDKFRPGVEADTGRSTAWVELGSGAVHIAEDVSRDKTKHYHRRHLAPHLPKTAPYDIALRCHPTSAVPQIQFNIDFEEDGAWHDFIPADENINGGKPAALTVDLQHFFPYLAVCQEVRLSEFVVERSKNAVKPAYELRGDTDSVSWKGSESSRSSSRKESLMRRGVTPEPYGESKAR